MDKKKNLKEIESFLKRVKKEIETEQVILFGSRARGDDWKRSDYDFIIVSTEFKDMPWLNRINKIVQLWNLSVDVDILPYTPEEFKEKSKNSSVVRTAVKEGVVC